MYPETVSRKSGYQVDELIESAFKDKVSGGPLGNRQNLKHALSL